VASERRTCAKGCGRKFSRPLGSRRVYCETCSPPRKPKASGEPAPVVHVGTGPIEAAALAELTAASRVDTFAGQMWLRLAREADHAPGAKVGTLVAAMLKVQTTALAGWKPPRNDRLDQLAAARARKAASA
jgi:hypothetical protein